MVVEEHHHAEAEVLGLDVEEDFIVFDDLAEGKLGSALLAFQHFLLKLEVDDHNGYAQYQHED